MTFPSEPPYLIKVLNCYDAECEDDETPYIFDNWNDAADKVRELLEEHHKKRIMQTGSGGRVFSEEYWLEPKYKIIIESELTQNRIPKKG